jgi:AraC-like DNA-binding protein
MGDESLLRLIQESIRFCYFGGGLTRLPGGYRQQWQTRALMRVGQVREGRLRVLADGHPPLVVEDREVFLVPSGLRHRMELVSRGPFSSCWSNTSFTVLGSIDACSLLQLPLRIVGARADRIAKLHLELARLRWMPQPTLHDAFRLQVLGLELWWQLVESAPVRAEARALLLHSQRLAPVLMHIDQRLDQPLDRRTLARLAGTSPSRFDAIFTAALRTAPISYVRELRLRRAQQLLATGDVAIQEIAAQVGYRDAFQFSKTFRQRFATSPSAYRAAILRGMP